MKRPFANAELSAFADPQFVLSRLGARDLLSGFSHAIQARTGEFQVEVRNPSWNLRIAART
jgi:hypothetical protein